MSVDKYAVCPCGSGKKIKFCKCKESIDEMDRVVNMVNGGQIVPALDRLSEVLQTHPDAAWALAIRGRLLLDLREYETLNENADRFIRLQPSNPLALTQRAAANLFRGQVEPATESMLNALTESGRDVDAFVLDVSSALAYMLAQRGVFLTSRVYAALAMMTTGYQGGQAAISVLQQLNTSPTINQLIKATPTLIPRPDDVEWAERYDEATSLLENQKIDLAESKFQSLQRTLPNEPAVLSGLLMCAIWRGDTDAQSTLFKKLSTCESLDQEQRVQSRALSALVDPRSPDLSIAVKQMEGPINNAEEVELSLMANSRFTALPPNMLGSLRMTDDEVPPRAGFQILDRDKPDSLDQLPPIDDVPEAIALVFVYGKQTDRDARIEVHDVRPRHLQEVKDRLAELIPGIELQESDSDPLPLLAACQPQVAIIPFKAKQSEAETLQADLMVARLADRIVNTEIPFLGGKTLTETANDETLVFERTVAVRLIEQYDEIVSKSDTLMSEVYRLANLTAPAELHPTSDEAELIANEDLNRVHGDKLDAETLIYLLQRCQQVAATPAARRFATQLIAMELTEDQQPAKMLAHMTLVNTAKQTDKALEALVEAKTFAEANQLPTAQLLLTEVSLRLAAGDPQGFQRTIESITSNYGNDPEVMARLQQMLMSYGLIGPDGAPRGGSRQAEPSGGAGAATGGLWTPDQGQQPPGESGGGGKLWVPGMD
ncbi:protein-disulfide isomerase [Rubripirellula sp.]|jgi:tetratricopeptide (TPR) repeat protein|nr:protein-disulfide isomerase [Rhodopirellula sp.]MDA9840690.1 protein-disulfide isomerase [Rubripirellula sp.]